MKTKESNLGIISLKGFNGRGDKVNNFINEILENKTPNNYLIKADSPRFNNGEAKVKILESVRGKDIYIIADIGNYNCSYKMFGADNRMSPDDHFQDIIRTISAIGGKAASITVFMPLLYMSRQHRRNGRESLDCAVALRELERLGVKTVLTFDAHDPNIQNATPNSGFDSVFPMYPMLKRFLEKEEVKVDKEQMLIISPDTGAMERAINYANALGLDVGMFYKRRDYSVIINGKNPVIQHEYTGRDVQGKTAIIVDDMIASGGSVIDVIEELEKRGIQGVYVFSTFAFFTAGLEQFDELYKRGILKRVYATNASYIREELRNAPWFYEVDLCKFIARLIITLNAGESISPLITSSEKIQQLLIKHKL